MKSNTQQTILTPDQQKAYDQFQGFLLSDQTEFHLFGAAGCGKTFLVRHFLTKGLEDYSNTCKLIGKEPYEFWDIYLTATTNKALEVLQQGFQNQSYNIETIYSAFNVVVKNDYKTGKSRLCLKNPKFKLIDALVFVDECSMLPEKMLDIMRKHSTNCKFVFIGDSYQLAPVDEQPHWDNTPNLTTARLYTPVRNQGKQALVDLCSQLRTTVETLDFKPIKLVPGVIEHLDDAQAMQWISNTDYSKNRILSYTNSKSLKYIELIKQQKGITDRVKVGEIYINNSHFANGNDSFYPEELIKVKEIMSKTEILKIIPGVTLKVFIVSVQSVSSPHKSSLVFIPENVLEYTKVMRILVEKEEWKEYFRLAEQILDLRSPYACTIHKAQGNTYEEVLIDCGSFKVCEDPLIAARLLYVAVSRAQNKVLFYGKLPKKYGEFI